jgi:NodT family efflux transporter outer membrane factor (OMF) lipoprotein
MRGWSVLLVVGFMLSMQGCVLKPEPTGEEARAQMLPNAKIPAAWTGAGAAPGSTENGWLEKFQDPTLRALVAEALEYNTDLIKAAARVEQAEGYVRVARGKLYPAVSASGRAGIEQSSEGSGLQGGIVSASWELDLWGRVRYGARGAADQYSAAQSDYAFARQSLAALVAKSWFLATEASLQRDLAGEMVAAASMVLDLSQDRERVGVGSEYDVALARVNLDTYRDNLVQLDLSREQSLRALEAVLGRYPSAEIAVANRLPQLVSSVPAGLPSELLERRPDIMAAERRIGAAFNRVEEARVARLPSLSLTGSISDFTSDLFVLQDREHPQWGIGGSLLAPLFTGGALKAQVSVRTAEQKEAVAAYASAALKAFSDVENALASESAMRAREAALAAAVTDAGRTLQLAETRYRVGSGDLRSVQQQQLSYNSARMNLLRVQSEQRVQRVNLHLALGGDYSASE